tara:strand:- start:94 stop:204 length:111 start_codon:yes stop_codon:yes gene_type:complete
MKHLNFAIITGRFLSARLNSNKAISQEFNSIKTVLS